MSKTKKDRGTYQKTTVNIPRPLYEAVKRLVEAEDLCEGYVSVDDFIRDLLRRRLREIKPTMR